jgi:hypothetical protein
MRGPITRVPMTERPASHHAAVAALIGAHQHTKHDTVCCSCHCRAAYIGPMGTAFEGNAQLAMPPPPRATGCAALPSAMLPVQWPGRAGSYAPLVPTAA